MLQESDDDSASLNDGRLVNELDSAGNTSAEDEGDEKEYHGDDVSSEDDDEEVDDEEEEGDKPPADTNKNSSSGGTTDDDGEGDQASTDGLDEQKAEQVSVHQVRCTCRHLRLLDMVLNVWWEIYVLNVHMYVLL